jgi:hypothetical protein
MAGKDERAYRKALIKLLEEEGVESWVEGRGSKHPYIEFMVNGRRIRQSYGTSPSDSRGLKNFRSQARRNINMARED